MHRIKRVHRQKDSNAVFSTSPLLNPNMVETSFTSLQRRSTRLGHLRHNPACTHSKRLLLESPRRVVRFTAGFLHTSASIKPNFVNKRTTNTEHASGSVYLVSTHASLLTKTDRSRAQDACAGIVRVEGHLCEIVLAGKREVYREGHRLAGSGQR